MTSNCSRSTTSPWKRKDLLRVSIQELLVPISDQGAIFVGFVFGSSTYYLYAFVASILAALIPSLI
jgi:hypothetical protein